jgi:hypothetical protein
VTNRHGLGRFFWSAFFVAEKFGAKGKFFLTSFQKKVVLTNRKYYFFGNQRKMDTKSQCTATGRLKQSGISGAFV